MILEGLDFDDVLIEPVVSSVNSRSNVNLEVTYTYHGPYDHKQSITLIPIVASKIGRAHV